MVKKYLNTFYRSQLFKNPYIILIVAFNVQTKMNGVVIVNTCLIKKWLGAHCNFKQELPE
jgi:hypothetical protein